MSESFGKIGGVEPGSEPFERIEVFEPGSREERCAWLCLSLAKEFRADHVNHPNGVVPTAFVFGADGTLGIVNLAECFDPRLPHGKDLAAESIRGIAAEERAGFWALLSDAWVHIFDGNVADARAAGLVLEEFRDWPPEVKARFPVRRQDALVLLMESRVGSKVVEQHYTERNGEVTWGELVVREGAASGDSRFADLLPPEEPAPGAETRS